MVIISDSKKKREINANLIYEVLRGDKKATDEFYKLIFPFLISQINKNAFKLSSDETKEFANDLFVKIYYKLNKFNVSKNIYPWLSVIVKNALIDHYRKEKRLNHQSLDLMLENEYNEVLTGAISDLDSPELIIIQMERKEQLDNLLNQLSTINKALVVDFYLEGKSQKELSIEYGLSVNTICIRLLRIKKKLKNLIKH